VVAQLPRMFERAQVDRHRRAQGHAFEVLAALQHVAAQGAGGRGHQHIVDRAIAGTPDRLHLLQVQRVGPCHPLADPEPATQQRGRVVRQGQRVHQLAREFAAFLRDQPGQGRIAVHRHPLLEHLAAQLHVLVDRPHPARHRNRLVLQPGLVEAAGARRIAGGIGQRQQHLHQRDAVRIAMVDARDHRRTALVTLHQVELPQWLGRVQRAGGELAGEALQRLLLRGGAMLARQPRQAHVPVEVEGLVLHPLRAGGAFHRLLPEPRICQEALFDHPLEPCQRHRFAEHQHAGDHHRVGRPLHPQPRGVHPRHRLAPGAPRGLFCSAPGARFRRGHANLPGGDASESRPCAGGQRAGAAQCAQPPRYSRGMRWLRPVRISYGMVPASRARSSARIASPCWEPTRTTSSSL